MCGGNGGDKALLYRGEAASSSLSTQVCIIDAFSAYGDHVVIDKLPREVPWDSREVENGYKDEHDPYCDCELIQSVVAKVHEFRSERGKYPCWWTNKSYVYLDESQNAGRNTAESSSFGPKLISNPSNTAQSMYNNNARFELPPRSAFLQTDLLPVKHNELPAGMEDVHRFGRYIMITISRQRWWLGYPAD